MKAALRAALAVAVVMLVLDLGWLGVVAADLYAAQLGALKAREVNALAAGLFYAMYVGATVFTAVLPAQSLGEAGKRGAVLGFIAYATYELTNWAVIEGWPAALVPVDLAWGVLLTGVAAMAGWKAR